MKPRQTVKNYPNSNVAPCPSQSSSSTNHMSALRDIDLMKLGLNLDDMSLLQTAAAASNNAAAAAAAAANTTNTAIPTNQEDIVKCLQAIYAKNSAEILQKLPTLNDWPMQSVSPPDYSRIGNNSSNGACVNGAGTTASGPNGIGISVGNTGTCASGSASFNSITDSANNISGCTSQQAKHDIQFVNSQLPHQAQPAVSQHFRVPSSNIHSPQQQQQQPQSQQSQQKSVLSLHQHHQNDSSNSTRRLSHHNHYHHNLSTSSTSFANLNSVNASNATLTSSSSLPSSDANTLPNNISISNSCSSGGLSHVSNIMDTLGSLDNMFSENPILINKDHHSSNQQQSLMKHQHLQKLLKGTACQLKPSSSPSTPMSMPRNDIQPQRGSATGNLLQNQLSISSPASTITPSQASSFSSVPKSLLNLAACSSGSPNSTGTNPTASKFSNMVSQLNIMSSRTTGNNMSSYTNNGKSQSKSSSSSNSSGIESSLNSNQNSTGQLQQHLTKSSTTTNSAQSGSSSLRSTSKQPFQVSLLSDDQSSNNRNRNSCNTSSAKLQSYLQRQFSSNAPTSKDVFLSNIQERAAKAGVSIGEISRAVQLTNAINPSTISAIGNTINNNTTVNISPSQSKEDFVGTVDRKEIESALSRVEARNDLSLLYPPMLLASNSQKQINALSAGFHGAEDSELFTKEVKRIVLEECNIIYECKECNNLFRSLANLVKHKRTYCLEQSSERGNIEANKRSNAGSSLLTDNNSMTKSSAPVSLAGDSVMDQSSIDLLDRSINLANRYNETCFITSDSNFTVTRGSERRRNLSNVVRSGHNQDRKNQDRDNVRSQKTQIDQASGITSVTCASALSGQSNLSQLLQSQPKHRLPESRDSALLGALNMAPLSSMDTSPLSAFESDKNNISCSTNEMHEQLVRNSSLAKTLLNEKARVTNPRQSLIELSKAESALNRGKDFNFVATKRVAPKSKFLEDCINRVKRNKQISGDEQDPQIPFGGSLIAETTQAQVLSRSSFDTEQGNIKINDHGISDADSDILTIDLDEPKRKVPNRRGRKKMGAAPSIAPSTSNSKMNTSSALLKALTRPVDTRKPFNSDNCSLEGPRTPAQSTSHYSQTISTNEEPNTSGIHAEIEDNIAMPCKTQLESESETPMFEKQTCDICGSDHHDLPALLEHVVNHHVTEKMVYPCIFCSFSFITLENVCRHILDIHKKPKAQVYRLKDVVRSRSYLSSDFLACSDYPATTAIMKLPDEEEASNDRSKKIYISERCEVRPEDGGSVAIPTGDESVRDTVEFEVKNDENQDSDEDGSQSDDDSSSSDSSDSNSSSTSSSGSSSSSDSSDSSSSSSSKGSSSSVSASSISSDQAIISPHRSRTSGLKDSPDLSACSNEATNSLVLPTDHKSLTKPRSSSEDKSQTRRDIKFSSIGKQITPAKSLPIEASSPVIDDDSNSQIYAESEEAESLDSNQVEEHSATVGSALSDHESSRQGSQQSKSSNRPNSETIPSTSSAGSGSGGIMRLKIQLKTRPDEKSKVYEIV